jgi:hypothetical protein
VIGKWTNPGRAACGCAVRTDQGSRAGRGGSGRGQQRKFTKKNRLQFQVLLRNIPRIEEKVSAARGSDKYLSRIPQISVLIPHKTSKKFAKSLKQLGPSIELPGQ